MNKLRTGFIVILLSISCQTHSYEACHVDVDGNGQLDALTDGLIIIRYLFGLSGSALTSNALGVGATRNAEQIAAFLAEDDCLAMSDIDGNGQIDALTDGLILIRSLFGLTGTALTQDALGINALRKSDAAILNHIASYGAQRSIVIESSALAPNAELSDAKQQVIVRNTGTTSAEVRVIEGVDSEGNPTFRIISEQGNFEIELPDPEATIQQRSIDQAIRPALRSRESIEAKNNDDWHLLKQGRKWFAKHGDIEGRLPPGLVVYNVGNCEIFDCQEGELDRPGWFNDINVRTKPSYQLLSMCDPSDSSCLHQGEPVLFIHGFKKGDKLGGGSGTWGDFPRLLSSRFYKTDWEMSDEWQATNHTPFEFRWRTNARFQDVARDLYTSIKTIHNLTGKKVHLVAHSFGGVLVRTLLQGIGDPDSTEPVAEIADVADYLASVVTMGAPLSGIADKTQSMFGITFPVGQDKQGVFNVDVFEGCNQLSCQQMGEDVLFQGQADLYRVKNKPGWLASQLSKTTDALPEIDFLSLIGLTNTRGYNISSDTGDDIDDDLVDIGDGLITGWGQRFHPSLGLNDAADEEGWQQLLLPGINQPAKLVGQARVTERILGMEGGMPGAANIWGDFRGYRHSIATNGNNGTRLDVINDLDFSNFEAEPPAEPFVPYCSSVVSGLCHNDHYVLSEVKNWIGLYSTEDEVNFPQPNPESPVGYLTFIEGNPGIEDDGIFINTSHDEKNIFGRQWVSFSPKPLVGTHSDGVTITVITKLDREDAYAQLDYEFGYLGTQCLANIHDNQAIVPNKATAEAAAFSLRVLSQITQNHCPEAEVSGMYLNRIEFLIFGDIDTDLNVIPLELDAIILDSGIVNRFPFR
jgi:hypothetical protein